MNLNCLYFERCKRISHSSASKKIEQSSIIPYLIRRLAESALPNHTAAHSTTETTSPSATSYIKIRKFLSRTQQTQQTRQFPLSNNDKPKREHTPELAPKQKYQHWITSILPAWAGTCEKPGALFLSGGKSANGRHTNQK